MYCAVCQRDLSLEYDPVTEVDIAQAFQTFSVQLVSQGVTEVCDSCYERAIKWAKINCPEHLCNFRLAC